MCSKAISQIHDAIQADQKVAVCEDVWTSGNNLCFLSVTGSFMDDNFQLQEILLGFKALEGHYIRSVLGTQCVDVLN